MKDLKDRAEMALMYMLQMDPSGETPHSPMGCYPVYADGKEDPATGVRIYGPIECDTQPDICEAFRWPGEENIWPAEIITDMPHVIDELLVYTSDLESELRVVNQKLKTATHLNSQLVRFNKARRKAKAAMLGLVAKLRADAGAWAFKAGEADADNAKLRKALDAINH